MSEFDIDVILLPPSIKRGRKKSISEKIVTFKISKKLLEKIDELARKKKLTRSELIRKALERCLSEELRKTG